jgi:FkbM family methyltransferase
MRERLAQWANGAGYGPTARRIRDRAVDFLEGNRTSTEKRNRIDDRNLKLLLSFCLRDGSNCLEVGANRGKFLKDIARVAPKGHHIAYEPVPNQWARLNSMFPQIDVRQRALSDRNGEGRFIRVLDEGSQGRSKLEDTHTPLPPGLRTETIVIQTERLDDSIPGGWLPDFVKIDVEGAELAVLRGAMETLREAKPIIQFELTGRLEEVYELLCSDVGLRMFDMDGHGPLSLPECREAARTRFNWVAHP